MWEEGIESLDRKFIGTTKDMTRFMGDLKICVNAAMPKFYASDALVYVLIMSRSL
jgi:hypothetical protein